MRLSFAIALVPAVSGSALAQTFLGPTPYLSENDRPADFLIGGLALEDFEDQRLDFGIQRSTGAPIAPAFNTDSVDGDDGSIDGSGVAGHSFFGFGPARFTFPAPVREAGIVWTDGPAGTRVTFEAFGPGMVSLGRIGPVDVGGNDNTGSTDEDRFFGIQDRDGIVAIEISSLDGNQSFEVDHIQFDTIGTSYCAANVNSSGSTGIQTVIGSPRVIDDEVTLVASRLPPAVFGYFLCSQSQGFVANAGGSLGNLCLDGAVGRFDAGAFNSGGTGSGVLRIDLAAIPTPNGLTAVAPGETWYFQAWHRDAGPSGPSSNFTDAVSLTFR
ncbi:MAG: hypothetical protein AAGA20_25015 [Planctomycetota bacterium]